MLWFNSSAAAANRPKLVIKYDRTPKAPSALQVTPGGPGYTTSLLPTFSALVSDPDGGSLRATLALLRDDQVVEAWTSGSVPSGTVVEWAVSEALEPDVNYVLRVGASDASSSSAPVTLPIRTDVWAPKVPAATCSGDCVSVPEVTLFDSAASSPLQPNETRLVEVRVPAVADPDDIDRLLARLQVSGAGGSGSLRVFNPEHTRPVAGTLNYVTGSAATTTLEVMPSIPMQLAIHNDGSSPVDAKLIAYAYYPWVDDEFEPLEATEPQSEVPVSSDESVVQFEPVRPLTAEQANAGGGDLPGVDADTQTCSPATDPDDPELDEVCVQAMTPGELEAVVAADHDLALQEAAEAGDATEVAARQAADQARITEINGCPWTAAKGPWTLKGRYSACKVTGMSLTGYKRVQGVKVPKWRFYFYLSEQYESHSNSLSTSHRYRFVYWKNWNKTKMKFVHEDLCVNDEVCDENSYLRYASFGKYDKQTEWFSTTFESAVADQEREELNSVLKLTGYWTRNVMRPSPEVRCDRLRYIPSDGCVLKNYTPTWELSRGGYPESADHIADSQAGGIAGSPSSGSPLQRKYWFGKKNLNRKDAKRRCSNYPRPAGCDCDEYPMSTTYDGCYLSGVCHVRWIPPYDNRGSGAKLGAFYRSNRVAEKDLFWVRIVS